MKKLGLFLLMISMLFLPVATNAKVIEYNILNLREALADEGITEEFSNYGETSNQITIYLFI